MNLKDIEDWKEKELAKATTQKEKDVIEAKYKYMVVTANGKL